MTTLNETYVNSFKINRATKTQLDNATELSPSELYLEDPEFVGGKLLETTADGDIVESSQTIPTVNNPTITFTQGGVTKGSFTLNQSTGDTIALDAGSGTVDQTYDSTSTNAQSGTAVAGAISGKVDLNAANLSTAGKSLISGLGMPSSSYVDLTLGASGATYAATDNGYVYWRKRASAPGQFIALKKYRSNNTNYEASVSWSVGANNDIYAWIPIRSGETFTANYTAAGSSTSDFFMFVYADGEV